MALLHERFYGLALDIAITFDLRDTITVIDFAVGPDGDAAKATVALHQIWGVSLHEVVETCIWINGLFNLHDTAEELAVLLFGVMRVAPLQNFLAQFEENWVVALGFDAADKVGISGGSIVLQILECECGGYGSPYTVIREGNDIPDNAVEMAGATYYCV